VAPHSKPENLFGAKWRNVTPVNPDPNTFDTKTYTLDPRPYILDPRPWTLDSRPQTLEPRP